MVTAQTPPGTVAAVAVKPGLDVFSNVTVVAPARTSVATSESPIVPSPVASASDARTRPVQGRCS
jgi:hypothetical protein